MIIDDNPADIELVAIAFELRSIVVETLTAVDGERGIALLTRLETQGRVPSLILLDLNMPRITGFDVLEYMRTRAGLASVPVIVFSSSTSPRDRDRSLALGAREFISKAVDLQSQLVIVDRLRPYLAAAARG
ncbi:MAG TPA: response regulator [Planctomycetota bacterium]|nr:response regulator [Planctomycetota bacterium]